MKRRMFIGLLLVFLLRLQTQSAFADVIEFARCFEKNDFIGITTLLRDQGNQMNLRVCLKTVAFNLALLSSTDRVTTNVAGITAIPINRNSILKTIQLLVEAGLDINESIINDDVVFKAVDGDFYIARMYRYDNILWVATSRDDSRLNIDIVKYLLSKGADVYKAKFNIDDDILAINRLLIEYGYNINNPTAEAEVSNGVNIPARDYLLTDAAKKGQIATVKLLVESGAMVNRIDYIGAFDGTRLHDGKTAAQFAFEKKEIDIYNYLKQNGAVWSPPSQVASAPPPSSQPRQTYNDSYDYSPPPASAARTQTPNQSSPSGWNLSVMSGTNNIGGTWNSSVGNGFMVLNGNGTSGSVNIQANGIYSSGTATISGNFLNLYITNGQFKGQQFRYTIVTNKLIQGDGENFSRY